MIDNVSSNKSLNDITIKFEFQGKNYFYMVSK